jgi:hypothetical protein
MILVAPLSLLLSSPALAAAAPEAVETDTTWTAADSPYVVDVETRVASGATLTLEPGVRIELAEGANFIVEGALIAQGTEAEPIVWTGLDSARWGSIFFMDSSVDAVFEDVDDYASGSILEHVDISLGSRALQLDAASPYIHLSTFSDNLATRDGIPFANIGAAAIYAGPGSNPRIRSSTFLANVADSPLQGGAIFALQSSPIFQDNHFEANESPYGAALTIENSFSPIVGNTFHANVSGWEGGAAAFVSASPSFLNNQVTDNSALTDGGGVHVCVTCYPHANPIMMDNVITGNTNVSHGSAGVGAAFLREFRYNDVHGNTQNGTPSDFAWHNEAGHSPDWVTYPNIAGNWWGTTDVDALALTLLDGEDEEGLGLVDLFPVAESATAAPTLRVTVTTRKIEYGIPDEGMPLVLTLYNPGAARAVDLVVMLQLNEGPMVVWRGALEGGERLDERVRMTLPENSVQQIVPIEPPYAESDDLRCVSWVVAAFDADTGERLGDVSTARSDMEAP